MASRGSVVIPRSHWRSLSTLLAAAPPRTGPITIRSATPLLLPYSSLRWGGTTTLVGSPMSAGAEADRPREEEEEAVVQYVVLRRDLIETWPMGSVVAQGCHASVAAIWAHKDDAHTLRYCSPHLIDSMHKVTLEVKGEAQMLNLSEKLTAGGIAHKLWIEQPENIPTCIATKPYPKSAVSSFFKKLKLCK